MKTVLFAFWIVVFCNSYYGQGEFSVEKQIAPGYPPAARAVRAIGDVSVSVGVNPDGKVISAKAYLGHPLLRAASENAALQWQFSKGAKEIPIRSTVLSFHFDIGEVKRVEESERSEEFVINTIFPSTFSSSTIGETLIPKLLLLPREKGVIKSRSCDIHHESMAVEIQSVDCNDNSRPPGFEKSEEYNDAKGKDFANANTIDDTSCRDGEMIEREEVYYCNVCRNARTNWILVNRN